MIIPLIERRASLSVEQWNGSLLPLTTARPERYANAAERLLSVAVCKQFRLESCPSIALNYRDASCDTENESRAGESLEALQNAVGGKNLRSALQTGWGKVLHKLEAKLFHFSTRIPCWFKTLSWGSMILRSVQKHIQQQRNLP